tara:strand:- start:943 stop:1431 length:489 start_codon:yes stop_codon:yes gene_type:complete
MVSGCQYISVHSSQMSAVISAFTSDSNESVDSLWAVEYGGYAAVVQPIALESSTVFVNDIDAVAFDGWRITKVSGLNSFIPAWEIYDSGSERSFVVNGQVVATHQCDQWLKESVEIGVRFEQHCIGRSAYTNTILVDILGQITDIEQVVDSSLMVLRLRLNN